MSKAATKKAASDPTESTLAATVAAFGKSILFGTAPTKLSIEDAASSYAALSYIEKLIKARKESLKPILDAAAEKLGETRGEKGTKRLEIGGVVVEKQTQTSHEPDAGKVIAYCKEQGLAVSEVCDEIVSLVLNPSKLTYCCEVGKLDPEVVKTFHSKTTVVKVMAADKLERLLTEAAPLAKKSKTQ